MKIVKGLKLHQAKAEGASETDQLLDDVYRVLNAVSPGRPVDGQKAENLDAYWVVYTSSATPDAEETLRHRLNRIPRFIQEYEVQQPSGVPNAGRVYLGVLAPTVNTVSVRCTTASKFACFLVYP